jgi:hypothetical protein
MTKKDIALKSSVAASPNGSASLGNRSLSSNHLIQT